MESDDPEDNKINECPICNRRFPKLAGLKQHVTKGHSQSEIDDAIAKKSSSDSQASQHHPTWNKFQIISESNGRILYRQFEVIETDASGDCLFSAVLEFLKERNNGFSAIPRNRNELPRLTVDFIKANSIDGLQSNFSHYKDSIVANLPQLMERLKEDASDETIQSIYSKHMSKAGSYGTTTELCAMAERFDFGYVVIQENDPENYTLFDYGSLQIRKGRPTLYMLFTGDFRQGHFRYLKSSDNTDPSSIEVGKYCLEKNCTSSRIKSVVPEHRKSSLMDTNENDKNNETENVSAALDDFVLLLARCKRNIRVLKRVPRGARILAARKLTQCIEECLAEPNLDSKWKKLLTFSYATLRVPDKIKNKSLASIVKSNVEKAELVFPKPKNKKNNISLSKRVEYKIAEGNVKGAVKLSSSSDTLAPQTLETFERLKEKHPPPYRELEFPEPPDKDTQPLQVTEKEVFMSIKSFPNGEAGLKLIKAITDLTNFMLRGKMNSRLTEILYGASLCALNKETGGIRPIAVGNTLSRVAAKLACASVRTELSSNFAPRQVGFGIRGGCEAAAHATRSFIKNNNNRRAVVLKIDFRNAFNEVDRDKFLLEMKVNCPSIYPFLWLFDFNVVVLWRLHLAVTKRSSARGSLWTTFVQFSDSIV